MAAGADFQGRHAWMVVRTPGLGGLGPMYLVERADLPVLAAVRLYPTPPAARDAATRVLTALGDEEATVPILDHGLTAEGDLWLALQVMLPADVRAKLRRAQLPELDEARLVEPLSAVFESVYQRVRRRIDAVVPAPEGGRGRLGSKVTGGHTWRILRPLGQGGIGSVYLGEREGDGWLAAVKFYSRVTGAREEAIRESAAMRVKNPATIEVRDAGLTASGEMWIAVDFVRGEDLRTRLERGSVPVMEAAALVAQLFAVLDVLHRAGVAHGDIKPENLLVEPGGRLRLVDFGRARLHHVYGGEGTFPGTAPYMHPSLFRGGAPGPHTDTFAAWVTLYELVAGLRPYAARDLEAAAGAGPLRRPSHTLPDPVLDRVVGAGLDGTLRVARPSWVALTRFIRGRTDLPRVRSIPPPPDSRDVTWAWEIARSGRSGTLMGFADETRAALEAVHREALRHRWSALWVRADWGSEGAPLSAALGLVGHCVDGLDVPTLGRVAEELGPLGAVLSQRLPAARTWLPAALPGEASAPETLLRALQAFVAAAPRPLLILVDRIDLVDGASRRFLGTLALSGEVPVLASAGPRGAHGLGAEREVPHRSLSLEPAVPPSKLHADILDHAAVLDLPFGPTLAAAMGVDEETVEDASLECEACGAARWNGGEVLPRPVHLLPDDIVRGWLREAARRLDPAVDPLRVAGYARRGGDSERLAEVIDAAVVEALARDPDVALRLLDEDPRPRTPERILRHFHVAVLARRVARAGELLGELRVRGGAAPADLAEAEGELAFRAGEVVPALTAYRRAAAALGRPVGEGIRIGWEFVTALLRLRWQRRRPPRPDARLARIFERLHDLQFTNDHAPMLRVHELWLEAAPHNPRARAMDVVWQTALGWHPRALALEQALLQEMDELRDPVGYAVVLLHRAIARTWRGEARAALSDAIDASAALLRAGDPYLAALCNTTITVCAIHVGEPDRLSASIRKTARLAELVGDARGSAWVAGGQAAWHWLVGDHAGAVRVAEQWAASARERRDSSEAAARRLLCELYAEVGQHEAALAAGRRAADIIAEYHLEMDFYSAWVIAALIADAQARRAGQPGLGRVGRAMARWRMDRLLARSPRWKPRAMAARGWQAAVAGRREAAVAAFEEGAREAHALGQAHDEWIVLDARARALDDAEAARLAEQVARRNGLKQGVTHGT